MFESIRQKLSRERGEEQRRQAEAEDARWRFGRPTPGDPAERQQADIAELERQEQDLLIQLRDTEQRHNTHVQHVNGLQRLAGGAGVKDIEADIAKTERDLIEANDLRACEGQATRLAALRIMAGLRQQRVEFFETRAKEEAATVPVGEQQIAELQKQLDSVQRRLEKLLRKK